MSDETPDPKSSKEKKDTLEIRDLTSKDDVKGGAPEAEKDEKRPRRRTGEIDFMKGVI